jgi:hypothetical protein
LVRAFSFQQMPQLFAQCGATRLMGQLRWDAQPNELSPQGFSLCAFATALATFESDE